MDDDRRNWVMNKKAWIRVTKDVFFPWFERKNFHFGKFSQLLVFHPAWFVIFFHLFQQIWGVHLNSVDFSLIQFNSVKFFNLARIYHWPGHGFSRSDWRSGHTKVDGVCEGNPRSSARWHRSVVLLPVQQLALLMCFRPEASCHQWAQSVAQWLHPAQTSPAQRLPSFSLPHLWLESTNLEI